MKKQKIPNGAVTPVLTFEFIEVQGPSGSGIGYLLSIAGAEDVVEHFWPTVQGRIDDDLVLDLSISVTKDVQQAVWTWFGQQGVLPMR